MEQPILPVRQNARPKVGRAARIHFEKQTQSESNEVSVLASTIELNKFKRIDKPMIIDQATKMKNIPNNFTEKNVGIKKISNIEKSIKSLRKAVTLPYRIASTLPSLPSEMIAETQKTVSTSKIGPSISISNEKNKFEKMQLIYQAPKSLVKTQSRDHELYEASSAKIATTLTTVGERTRNNRISSQTQPRSDETSTIATNKYVEFSTEIDFNDIISPQAQLLTHTSVADDIMGTKVASDDNMQPEREIRSKDDHSINSMLNVTNGEVATTVESLEISYSSDENDQFQIDEPVVDQLMKMKNSSKKNFIHKNVEMQEMPSAETVTLLVKAINLPLPYLRSSTSPSLRNEITDETQATDTEQLIYQIPQSIIKTQSPDLDQNETSSRTIIMTLTTDGDTTQSDRILSRTQRGSYETSTVEMDPITNNYAEFSTESDFDYTETAQTQIPTQTSVADAFIVRTEASNDNMQLELEILSNDDRSMDSLMNVPDAEFDKTIEFRKTAYSTHQNIDHFHDEYKMDQLILTLVQRIKLDDFTADEKQVIESILRRKWKDIRKEVNNFKDISNDNDDSVSIDILNEEE